LAIDRAKNGRKGEGKGKGVRRRGGQGGERIDWLGENIGWTTHKYYVHISTNIKKQ